MHFDRNLTVNTLYAKYLPNWILLSSCPLLYCPIIKKRGLTKSDDWKDSISNFRPHQTTITLVFLENNHRINLTRSSTPQMMSLLSLFTGDKVFSLDIKKKNYCCLSSTEFLDSDSEAPMLPESSLTPLFTIISSLFFFVFVHYQE